jgi:hypothetical protein
MLPMRELYAACNDSDHARESVTRLVLSWVHCDESDLVIADAGSFSDMHLFGLGLCHVLCTHDPLATRLYDAKEELGEFLETLTAGVDIHASSWIELRQLIRALQTSYLQLITYDRFAGYDCLVDVSKYVLVLMTRVGALLGTMFRWDSLAPEDQVRLSEFYEHEADGFHILKTRTCAEAIDVLHSLTRLVLTLVHATPVGAAACKPDLTKFHHEASLDDFYQLATAQDCLPGSIAAYKNQFHGLFHDVSQVAYYLYPTYTRRVQVPIADFAADKAAGINILPLLMQVKPDVPVVFEHTRSKARSHPWAWLVWHEHILLCQQDGGVFCAKSVYDLFAHMDADAQDRAVRPRLA